MTNPFTLKRWKFQQWQMFLLLGLAWCSIWQIVDNHSPERWGIAVANLGGSSIALLALHLRDHDLSRAIERWAYLALIWAVSCYLSLALQGNWWALVLHQPNLGVVAAEAIVLACIFRTIYTVVCKRVHERKVKRRADEILSAIPETQLGSSPETFPHDSVQLVADTLADDMPPSSTSAPHPPEDQAGD